MLKIPSRKSGHISEMRALELKSSFLYAVFSTDRNFLARPGPAVSSFGQTRAVPARFGP